MGNIKQLDNSLIDQIAAGEVVERPASVLKELVENGIDAGASQIIIELEDGGKKYIRVADNGCGMDEEDARLALVRHATSKIQTTDDLFNIQTMGFRGEALASIQSVSKFTLATRKPQAELGSKISNTKTSDSAKPDFATSSWSGSPGTEICVSELFYNVPVRKKFLKSSGAEYSACLEFIQALSLAKPEISIKLFHNQKEKFSSEGRAKISPTSIGEPTFRARLEAIWGEDIVKQLLYAESESDYGKAEVLLSPPGCEKATSKQILMFVNQRWVKDKTLRFAVQRGYYSHLLKGRYPICAINFSCDPSLVDVNVHPNKSELRFQYPGEAGGLIASTIGTRLRRGDWTNLPVQTDLEQPSHSSDFKGQLPAPSPQNRHSDSTKPSKAFTESSNTFKVQKSTPFQNTSSYFLNQRLPPIKATIPTASEPKTNSIEVDQGSRPGSMLNTAVATPPNYESTHSNTAQSPPEQKLFSTEERKNQINWDDLDYIGQFRKCYLMFESQENGLLLIDQHAFHERILYEQLITDKTLLTDSQPLLIPEVLSLSASEVALCNAHQQTFSQAGFKVQTISDMQIEVLAVPALLREKGVESYLRGILDLLQDPAVHTTATDETLSHQIIATLSCHSAVRSGDELNTQMRENLLRSAKGVDFYHNCPHGRRVLRWFKPNQVANWFDRV